MATARSNRLLSIKEAHERLGVSRALLYRLIAQGRIRSCKINKRRLISDRALGEYIDQLEREAVS